MDDAETERLPSRHRIRPRERLPAKVKCPRELISDQEIFSTSSPLLRQGLSPRRKIIEHSSTLVLIVSTSEVYRYVAAPVRSQPLSATVLVCL